MRKSHSQCVLGQVANSQRVSGWRLYKSILCKAKIRKQMWTAYSKVPYLGSFLQSITNVKKLGFLQGTLEYIEV